MVTANKEAPKSPLNPTSRLQFVTCPSPRAICPGDSRISAAFLVEGGGQKFIGQVHEQPEVARGMLTEGLKQGRADELGVAFIVVLPE